MIDSIGALVDFNDVLSFGDPMIASTLASIVKDRLAAAHCREFRLTSRVIVLVFNAGDAVLALHSLAQLDRDLVSSHHGKLVWKIFDLNSDVVGFRRECMNLVERAAGTGGHEELLFRLDADRLGALMHIVDSLATVDLTTHMRVQAAVRYEGGKPKAIEFEETWVSLEGLEQAFEAPLESDPFRFGVVTELLDMRVLRSIVRDRGSARRISLNFHARNTLTSQFTEIAHKIVESRRRQMIFELPIADLIQDADQFTAATKRLTEFGFQIALDGVIWPAVESVSKTAASVNIVKAPWNEAFKGAGDREHAAVREVMARYPAKTFVLSRCDDGEACRIGLELGFKVLQGRGVTVPSTMAPRAHRTAPRLAARTRR
jgi:hypothetical protein